MWLKGAVTLAAEPASTRFQDFFLMPAGKAVVLPPRFLCPLSRALLFSLSNRYMLRRVARAQEAV
ncbi:protein of unknown function [Paraburkholderia kururiensis]